MSLNDIKCKTLKPRDKPYKATDEKGLYLEVMPSGSKYWRLKYYFAGKENRLAIGVYPAVSLKDARDKREIAKKQIAEGIDPSHQKKLDKLQKYISSENTFEAIAREWHGKQAGRLTARHSNYVLRRLEAYVFPMIGFRPINQITAPELLATIQKIEAKGIIDIAKRALQTSGQIFRYAIATGRAERDISTDLKGALIAKKKVHHPSLKENEIPEFLEKLEKYDGDPQTKLALKFLMLTFVRTIELRKMLWSEINFDKKEWHVPFLKMKMQQKHIVPLSKQALEILKQIRSIHTNQEFVFPSHINPNKPISENTLLFAMYRMGYHSKATPHGLRSTASTILNENGFNRDHIEIQLSHSERDTVRASYNYAQYLPQHTKMMAWWGNYIESKK